MNLSVMNSLPTSGRCLKMKKFYSLCKCSLFSPVWIRKWLCTATPCWVTQTQSRYLSQERHWTLTGIPVQPLVKVSYQLRAASLSCLVPLLCFNPLQTFPMSELNVTEGPTMTVSRSKGSKDQTWSCTICLFLVTNHTHAHTYTRTEGL